MTGVRRLAAVVVLAVLPPTLIAGCGDDDGESTAGSSTTTTLAAPSAIAVAQARLAVALDDARVDELIDELCAAARTADPSAFADSMRGLAFAQADELGSAIGALAAGAHVRCPDQAAAIDVAVDETYGTVSAELAPASAVDLTTGMTTMQTLPAP